MRSSLASMSCEREWEVVSDVGGWERGAGTGGSAGVGLAGIADASNVRAGRNSRIASELVWQSKACLHARTDTHQATDSAYRISLDTTVFVCTPEFVCSNLNDGSIRCVKGEPSCHSTRGSNLFNHKLSLHRQSDAIAACSGIPGPCCPDGLD